MIQITSISTNLGANVSVVAFKVFDDSTALKRVTGEYQVEVEGRYDTLDSHELIHKLEAILIEAHNNG